MGGFEVVVEAEPARLVIAAADGRVLVDGLPGGAVADDRDAVPMVAAAIRASGASYEHQFGAFKIEPVAPQPWRGALVFADARIDGDTVAFGLRGADDAALGTVAVSPAGDGALAIEIIAGDADHVSLAFACDPDEHFLGFGGQSFDVDHRGQTVPLWVQEDGIGKAEDDYYEGVWFLQGRRHSTHTPMPMYLSSRGYALALDTPHHSVFAMCSEDPDAVRVEVWEPRMALRVFDGPSPAQAIERMTAWVGRPAVPPGFAFAPWLDAIFGSDNVRRVVRDLRDAGVAGSVIWTEDWRGGRDAGELGYELEEDWEVDRDLYPDFEEVAADVHAAGFKFLTYNNSFLDAEVPAYAEAVAGGYTIHDAAGDPYLFTGVKFSDSSLLDLSNPDAVAWAQRKYRDGLELGADGYMADFAEWLPTDAVLASGQDAVERHNLYPVDWARLNRELIDTMQAEDGVERLFFVRSAYLGSQSLVSVVWAGDQQTDFSIGDGMPSVIPIGIGLGVTGFPYFGHDIAGYMSRGAEPVTRELWFRWVTFGALSPVMRTHHGRSAADNWNWESDDASKAHMARWTDFHMRLYPYLMALAHDAATTGIPMFRPLALAYPDFEPGWTATDQFSLGDRLIVAPIVTEGATSRRVALPEGTFYPLAGGPAVSLGPGGGDVTAAAPLEDIPVFVPAGSILVLLPEGVDTVVDADPAAGLVTLADVADDRAVWVWAGGGSTFTEADGQLDYAWDGAGLSALPTTAEVDGAPLDVVTGDGWIEVELTGPGALRFDGGAASLDVSGGSATRALTVRVHAP